MVRRSLPIRATRMECVRLAGRRMENLLPLALSMRQCRSGGCLEVRWGGRAGRPGLAPIGVHFSTAVILSAAKDLRSAQRGILRYAQDDGSTYYGRLPLRERDQMKDIYVWGKIYV